MRHLEQTEIAAIGTSLMRPPSTATWVERHWHRWATRRCTPSVMNRLDREITQARWRIGSNHVLLMHDHVETCALFTQLVDRLLAHGIDFRLPY